MGDGIQHGGRDSKMDDQMKGVQDVKKALYNCIFQEKLKCTNQKMKEGVVKT